MNYCKKFIKSISNFFSCFRKQKEEDPRKYTYYKLDNTSFYNNTLYKELTFENLKQHNEKNNCYKRINNDGNFSESIDSLCHENYYDNVN